MKRSTKSSLLMSVVAMLLCVSMLVGSTFAWFTDSVTATNNVIVAGNLDVELYYQNDETTTWKMADATSNIFKTNTLWEPGHVEVIKLKVVNEGTLALKYNLGINIANEVSSINIDGDPFKLSDYIKFGVVDGDQTYTREEAVAAVEATATPINKAYTVAEKLDPASDTSNTDEKIVTLVVYMPETVDNAANYGKGQAIPTINLGLNVFATQLMQEEDSFDNTYDEYAGLIVTDFADLQKTIDEAPVGATVGIAEGTYRLPAQINVNKDITIVGLGDVVIDCDTGWHMFMVSNYYDTESTMNVTMKNLTLNGNNKAKAGIYVKYDTVLNLENVSVNGTNWADIQIDNANTYFDGSYKADCATVVNAKGVNVEDVALMALPSNASSLSNEAHINFDASSVIGTIERQQQCLDHTNLFINGVAGTSASSGTSDTLQNYVVSTTAEAQAALDAIKPGATITLKAGDYDTLTVKNFWGGNYTQTGVAPITINSAEGAKVGAIDLNGMNFVNIDGITFDAAKAVQVYAGSASGDYGNVVDSANDESKSRGANHISITNCTFTGTPAVAVGNYCPINFMGSNPSSWTYNITVSGCKFLTNAQNFIRMNNVTNNGSVTIIGNTFGGDEYTTNHHAINASANGGDWTITGNTFINWNPKKCAFATGRSTADGTTDFVITGNTFSNTRIPTAEDGDDGVIEIKTNSYTTTNQTLVFENNTFAGALAGLDETTVKYVKP